MSKEYYIVGRAYRTNEDCSLSWATDGDWCPYVLVKIGYKNEEDAQNDINSWIAEPEKHTILRSRFKNCKSGVYGAFGDENGNPEPIAKLHNNDFKIKCEERENLWWNIYTD